MKIRYRIYLVTIDEWHQYYRFRIIEINDEKVSFNDELDNKYPNGDYVITIDDLKVDIQNSIRIAVDIGWQIIEYIYNFMHSDCAFYTLSYTQSIMKKFTPNYTHLEYISPA